jgi:hypothetical protein
LYGDGFVTFYRAKSKYEASMVNLDSAFSPASYANDEITKSTHNLGVKGGVKWDLGWAVLACESGIEYFDFIPQVRHNEVVAVAVPDGIRSSSATNAYVRGSITISF